METDRAVPSSAGTAPQVRRRLARAEIGFRLYITLGALLLAGLFATSSGIATTRASAGMAFVAAAAVIAGCALNPARRQRGWLLLALGLVSIGVGDAAWVLFGSPETYMQKPGQGVPVLVDAGYVVGYSTVVAALWILGRSGSRRRDVASEIDVGIVALGIALVTWLLVANQAVDMPGGRVASGAVVPAAYGLTGCALAVTLVRMLFRAGGATRSIRLLELATAGSLAAAVMYLQAIASGTWTTGSIVDAGWLVAYLLWSAASLDPTSASGAAADASESSAFSFGRAASLATACLVVPASLVWAWAFGDVGDLPVIAVASALLSLLWTARVTVSLRRLRRSLDERRALEGRLRDQAMRDPLVGLPNRTSFEHRLSDAIAAERDVAVLYLDLDDFKVVNDTLGHAAGDAVLVQAARRVGDVLRSADLAARLGGDEFGILLCGADQAVAEAVARRVLGALRAPFSVEERTMRLNASIGIALGGPGKIPADLMREADVAMYLAKGQGKSRYQVFETSMHTVVMGRMALRAEIEQAIANREFELHYQPIVTASLDRVVACEALIRWRHPVRGLLAPAEFVDLAEETGLIVPLGHWVLEEACRDAARWRELTPGAPAVTINVSPVQFRQPEFVEDLWTAARSAGVDPSAVILEITESTLIDTDDAHTILPELRGLGFRIALDDFGTGYSSLAYLARYPIDILKIDRAFVAALGTGAREDRLAAAIVGLSQDLRLEVIAEGVETPDQLERLARLGCDWIQGYLVARPVPAEDIGPMLASRAGLGPSTEAESAPAGDGETPVEEPEEAA